MARETYVRPPLIGREAPSNRLAIWRYRLIALLLLLLLVIAVIWLVLRLTGIGSEDPGFGGALRQLPAVLAAR